MAPFKVLIAGGSVAGMALANMLERYGIDYELLEKHATIAPQLGASIAIVAHGSRILEQLGCWDTIEAMSTPVNKMTITDPEGRRLAHHSKFGDQMEELIGYKMRFLDRRQVIQILFDNLKDKSRIHMSAEVVKTEITESGVVVETKDGSKYSGSILVGADGVHSRVRQEMWRIADAEKPGFISDGERNSITCTYSCMFGISDGLPSIKEDESFKAYHEKRSCLYQGGLAGKVYWFLFIKNERKTVGKHIPRYSANDEKLFAEKYAADALDQNLTFNDLYRRRQAAVLVPLEEYVLKNPFYKRLIVIGDSYHKFNPLTGQGGNAALESAAFLSDLLADALGKDASPGDKSIQHAFTLFRDVRGPRTVDLMKNAKRLQQAESLDNPVIRFLSLNILSKFETMAILQMFVLAVLPGKSLRRLPAPKRQRLLAFQEDLAVKPSERSSILTWMSVAILILAVLLPYRFPQKSSSTSILGSLSLYNVVSMAAINVLWVVESNRPAALLTPFGSAIPFTLASLVFGWNFVVPLYFAFYIYKSQSHLFYFPTPRELNVNVAKAIPIAFCFTYSIPLLYTLQNLGNNFTPAKWNIAHILLPIVVTSISSLLRKISSAPRVPRTAFAGLDVPYLLRSFTIMIFVTSTAHILFVAKVVQQSPDSGWSIRLFSNTDAKSLSLALSTMIWCFFTAWDMRRVRVAGNPLALIWLAMLSTFIFLGPATLLAVTWRWREVEMENSRKTRNKK